jgi:ElaB/YqjD/DUF883 family membrane-anchored ribosome-binding protein
MADQSNTTRKPVMADQPETTRKPVMADQPNADIAALQSEIKQLRADITKIAGTMRGLASNGVAGAEERVMASADKIWNEAKRHAENVSHEIEERPIASAFTAFATGIVLGLLLSGRRG